MHFWWWWIVWHYLTSIGSLVFENGYMSHVHERIHVKNREMEEKERKRGRKKEKTTEKQRGLPSSALPSGLAPLGRSCPNVWFRVLRVQFTRCSWRHDDEEVYAPLLDVTRFNKHNCCLEQQLRLLVAEWTLSLAKILNQSRKVCQACTVAALKKMLVRVWFSSHFVFVILRCFFG